MKEVYIKYNPYRIETDITVDGKSLAENSHLGESISSGIRLQEWIEELPQNLIDEYNDREFNIKFYGTLLDFEDLTEVFNKYCEQGQLTVKLNRKPAKESQDKEKLIDCVFEKIQNGPFSELRDVEIINAFEHAKSSDFEVCVVATMSAGKSTLINSMLRTKLMPSKQEACTSIITKLKDNDSPHWQAEVYNKENRLIEAHENLSISTMERLNSDENVSVIKATGNIPFVTADDVSLILIDTPGPNNSRDPEHKRVQSEFLNKSSKSLVLYIMEGTFGTDDDNALLERVAESMSVGGKQSKDRFIFVVNKMDSRNTEDGDTSQTLTRVRTYLKKHGIINPNLFPAAALPALNIRRIKNGEIVDAAIFLDQHKILPVDSKFSLENYNRMIESEGEKRKILAKKVRDDLKMRIDETSKYIRPDENTMDFAFMFIPSESLYYDMLINKVGSQGSERDLIEYAFRDKRVIVVSPTSFMAYLQTVLQGLKSLKIEEQSKEIQKRVSQLGTHISKYEDLMQRLGKSLGTTVNHFNNAHKELGKIDKDVVKIAGENKSKIKRANATSLFLYNYFSSFEAS